MATVLHVDAFEDNYIWLILGDEQPAPVIVDPGDEEPVIEYLDQQQLQPAAILCTHHHWDHHGGITALRQRYDIPAYGPAAENIEGISQPLADGDCVRFPETGLTFQVIAVPGHTRGHIAYFGQGMLFCGDTLFSGGCGRLFEGTPEQMHTSLQRLAALPADTSVYCAHEYTLANLRFARAVEPENEDLRHYQQAVQSKRERGDATLPSTLALELRINPFLRTAVPAVQQAARQAAQHTLNGETEVFAALRRWKDQFHG